MPNPQTRCTGLASMTAYFCELPAPVTLPRRQELNSATELLVSQQPVAWVAPLKQGDPAAPPVCAPHQPWGAPAAPLQHPAQLFQLSLGFSGIPERSRFLPLCNPP